MTHEKSELKREPMDSASEARKIFARNFEQILKSRSDINLKKVSDVTGLSYPYLSAIKGGKENISVDKMSLIAEAVGVELFVMLTPEKEEED